MMQSPKKKNIWKKTLEVRIFGDLYIYVLILGFPLMNWAVLHPPKSAPSGNPGKYRGFLARSLDKQLVYFTYKTGAPQMEIDLPPLWIWDRNTVYMVYVCIYT